MARTTSRGCVAASVITAHPGLQSPAIPRCCARPRREGRAMAEIDYYLFPLSPFSYLAGLELEAIAARHGATITYKPVQLFRIFAEIGTPLRQGPPRLAAEVPPAGHRPRRPRQRRCRSTSSPRHFPTNPVPASAAIIPRRRPAAATSARWCTRFLRAVWAEERDIAEDEVVRDILARPGFDPALADRGLLDRGRDARAQHRRGDPPLRLRRAELRRRRGGLLGPGPPAAPRRRISPRAADARPPTVDGRAIAWRAAGTARRRCCCTAASPIPAPSPA